MVTRNGLLQYPGIDYNYAALPAPQVTFLFGTWDGDYIGVRYRLPGIPTKEGDSRAKSFIERFGDRATELDALEALHPGELAKIVREALEPYSDRKNPKKVMDENDRIAKATREMLEAIRPKRGKARKKR
jgi:hypothetical protein